VALVSLKSVKMKKRSILVLIILVGSYLLFARKTANNEITTQLTYIDTTPAKTDTTYINENGEVKVFEKVDVEAEFPGGLPAWREFIISNLRPDVPVNKGAPAGEYTVVVQFIVDKEGSITEIKAVTNYGYGMEAEVIRMIKKSPQWTPAQQGDHMVKAYRKQPITFVVEEVKKKKRSRD
jgi:hypothetical protein